MTTTVTAQHDHATCFGDFAQQRTNKTRHALQAMEQQADLLMNALLDDTLPAGLADLDRLMTAEQAAALKQRQEPQVCTAFVIFMMPFRPFLMPS